MATTAFAVPQSCGQATQAAFAAQQVVTDTDGTTVTFDMSLGATHLVVLGGSRTLAVTKDAGCNKFVIILGTGAGGFVPVWWAGIRWPGGVAPTVTATANKYDIFEFINLGGGVYLGRVKAQNL